MSCSFLFAPMEGITYSAFRTLHHELFPQAAEYFTPFIAPDSRGSFKPRYLKELTAGYPSVPQLLVNNADAFNLTARKLADLGFREINLNTGCPSGTVYAKHKGAGMLRDLQTLEHILEDVFEQAERVGYGISIKTRMGDHSTAEFPDTLAVYNRFPLRRLIVHARCRDDFYRGEPDLEGFCKALAVSRCPLVYNGDIRNRETLDRVRQYVEPEAVMIGRGAVANPALFRELTGGSRLRSGELQVFLDGLRDGWLQAGLGSAVTLERMKTLWVYMKELFPSESRLTKKLLKARVLDEYSSAVSALLSDDRELTLLT